MNKYWVKSMREAEKNYDGILRLQTLIDTFHLVRSATVLMHTIAPQGTEMVLDYLNLNRSFWNWDFILKPVYYFMADPEDHQLKFLEPRVDFFKKHSSQLV